MHWPNLSFWDIHLHDPPGKPGYFHFSCGQFDPFLHAWKTASNGKRFCSGHHVMILLFMSMHYVQCECCRSTHLRGPSLTMQTAFFIGFRLLNLLLQNYRGPKKQLCELIETQSWCHLIRNSVH